MFKHPLGHNGSNPPPHPVVTATHDSLSIIAPKWVSFRHNQYFPAEATSSTTGLVIKTNYTEVGFSVLFYLTRPFLAEDISQVISYGLFLMSCTSVAFRIKIKML